MDGRGETGLLVGPSNEMEARGNGEMLSGKQRREGMSADLTHEGNTNRAVL